MNVRSAMSQVKTRVRREVLFLHSFTAAEIISATRLNPDSVRTELQRMKREGFLTSERGNGREALYQVSDDPEKRLALSQSLHPFDAQPSTAVTPPTSDYYRQAQQQLDAAMEACKQNREPMLQKAKILLEKAEAEEGYVFASEAVLSYIGYEHARLAYLLGMEDAAARSFQLLRPFFANINDALRLADIDEFLVLIEQSEFEAVNFADVSPARALRACLDRVHSRPTPLLSKAVDILDAWTAPSTQNVSFTPVELGPAIKYFGPDSLHSSPAALAA